MGFVRWAFSRNAPTWVSNIAFALAVVLALGAWIAFLTLAGGLAVIVAISFAFLVWLFRAYQEYRRDRAAGCSRQILGARGDGRVFRPRRRARERGRMMGAHQQILYASEQSAARLLDMRPAEFRALVDAGALPPPPRKGPRP